MVWLSTPAAGARWSGSARFREGGAALKREGADLNIAQELGEFSTMLALVSAGLGIGVIPAAAAMALPPKVVARPLELRDYKAGIGLACATPANALKRALLDVIDCWAEGG